MKKRIVCVLLALIMLVGMLPLSASAAGLSVSERAITVLKQLQKYSSTCSNVNTGSEWRNGYGTICSKSGDHTTHTISEIDADKALRTKLAELDAAVNASGLSLNQNQHDALVVFSYDCGTSWLSGTGVLKTAVSNGLTGNAFLNAIGQSAGYGSDNTDKISGTERRMIEANMYLNGAYSNIAPSNYSYVTYNANGGTMAEGSNGLYTQYYDANTLTTPAPVPTKAGHIFLGWYDGNTWVSKLASFQSGKNLVAWWQAAGAAYTDAPTVYNWLSLNMLSSAYIYAKPTDTEPTDIHSSSDVILDRDYIDANGARWGRLANGKGWVKVSNGTSGTQQFDVDVTVTVTNSYLRSRVNASVSSAQNGSYSQGDQLRIINTANGSGFLWGQVADENGTAIGWVALMYTNWNAVKDNPAASGTTSTTDVIANAVINCQGYLNVRSGAGTDNAIVGALADGDHVDIYEIKFVNGHKWGRTTQGWILLTYAKVTMTGSLDYSSADDVLAYTFTGTLKKDLLANTDASDASDTVGSKLYAGTTVAVSMVKNDEDGKIWGFNGTGWIKLSDVNMDIAKYVVVADSITVRNTYNTAVGTSKDKILKGVELDIVEIAVVDATIWGYTTKYEGWVNLASKYVQRSNAPVIENVVSSNLYTGLVATVINTNSVKVRSTGAIYGSVLGSLSNGTTVAVWEANEDCSWYKLDSNMNGVYDYEGDGWASAKYLDVYTGTIEDDSADSTSSTTTGTTANTAVETGLGIVANTYTGVNVRQGAGTGYAVVGKILTGTTVEILEVTSTATSKWGRTEKGWVCMDYITMVSKYPVGGTVTETTDSNAGQNVGGYISNTEGNTTTVSTPAIYAGTVVSSGVSVQKTADADAISIGQLNTGENVTIQELVKVTTKEVVSSGTVVDGNATTETTTSVTDITFWARVNGGWIQNPQTHLKLQNLDEAVYTVVNYAEVNVRDQANGNTVITTLDKGTQVAITELQIVEDKVWGFAENVSTNGGWIRLDNLSEGAITVATETNTTNTTTATTATTTVVLGNGSNVGGYVTNASGYRYTGKVINTNEVNVRSTPSTASAVTTTLKYGASLVVYETTISENMAWGRCDAGWVYLYYVDLTPVVNGAVDARVVYNENSIIYTDVNCSGVAGTYARMSVIDIYEIVGDMARTDKGWVKTTDLL